MQELIFIYMSQEPLKESNPKFEKILSAIVEMVGMRDTKDVFYYRHDNKISFFVKQQDAEKYMTALENNIKENDPMYKVLSGAYSKKDVKKS